MFKLQYGYYQYLDNIYIYIYDNQYQNLYTLLHLLFFLTMIRFEDQLMRKLINKFFTFHTCLFFIN